MPISEFRKVEAYKKRGMFVAEQIIDAIKSGKLLPGDKLPPERELAELMGVSRNSCREGISALQMAGIVWSKPGDGTYVSFNAHMKISSGLRQLIGAGVDVLYIWKAKKVIETILLNEAIERVSQADIASLEAILQKMETAASSGNFDVFAVGNIDFHVTIADISADPWLTQAENYLLRVAQQIYRIADASNYQNIRECLYRLYVPHVDILNVLKTKDMASVDAVMERHFKEVENFLREALSVVPSETGSRYE